MIYPTLHLATDSTTISYIDTDFNENPFLETEVNILEEGVEAWFTLLTAFMSQYWQGYDNAIDDMNNEDEEQGDIQWM